MQVKEKSPVGNVILKMYEGEFRKVSHLSLFHMQGFNNTTGIVRSSNCLKYHFYLKRHNFNITDLFFKTLEQNAVMLFW